MQENALTPATKAVAIQLATELQARNLTCDYSVSRALFNEFAKTTANTFGLIPHVTSRNPMSMEVSKARREAFGESLLLAAEQLAKSGEAFDNWGYATDAVCDAVREAGNTQVHGYKLAKVINGLLTGSISYTDVEDYNNEVLRGLKRAKYLKKVAKDDPLRSGISDDRTVYEYTDAIFDDHIPEFADVLFIGHQLRVVKDSTDNTYYIHKIGSKGQFVCIGWVQSLREAVVELASCLKRTEENAVAEAIEAAKRGKPLGGDKYTEREVRELAQAQGKEIPDETQFKVCHTGYTYRVVPVEEVSEETAVSVVSAALPFTSANELAQLFDARDNAQRTLERRVAAVEDLTQKLKDANVLMQVAEEDAKAAELDLLEKSKELKEVAQ